MTNVTALNPNTMSARIGQDITDMLKPYYPYTRGFHKLDLKNCYLYLTQSLEVVPSFFIKNDRVVLPTVELYDLKAGSKQGVRFGFIFRSPLPCVYTKNYLLFHRKQIDTKEVVVKGRTATRNYHIGDLLFFTLQDDAVLVSNLEHNSFTESLEQ